jgi:hypothetical protein
LFVSSNHTTVKIGNVFMKFSKNEQPPQFTITPDEHSSKNVGPNDDNNIIALHSYSSLSLSLP